MKILCTAVLCVLALGCQLRAGHSAPGTTEVKTTDSLVQTQPVSKHGSVSITAIPQFNKVHLKSIDQLNVLIKLKAKKAVDSTRPPMDLSLVVDTSGSMSGAKIRDVKAAAISLVNTLNTNDRVSLIAYSSSVRRLTTFMPANEVGKAQLTQKIMALTSGGSTALGPAIFEAFQGGFDESESISRLKHVILLSDGLANVGEKRPQVLARRCAEAFRQGISISTMGVGLDYNEDLMTKLADTGGGRYHFIQESRSIAQVLDDELRGLVGTVAKKAHLTISPIDGVRVAQVYGYSTRSVGLKSRSSVGFMSGGQTREILVRLSIDPSRLGMKASRLANISLEYDDVNDDSQAKKVDFELSVGHVASEHASRKTENTEVTIRVAEIETSAQLEMAARAVQSGDYEDARSTIKGTLGQLRKRNEFAPSARLREQIANFEEAAKEVEAAPSSIRASKSFAKKFKARAYTQGKR